jgi:hypothetical protein
MQSPSTVVIKKMAEKNFKLVIVGDRLLVKLIPNFSRMDAIARIEASWNPIPKKAPMRKIGGLNGQRL